MSDERPRPKPSLKEIAARAKDASAARASSPPGSLSPELLASMTQGRPSAPPASVPAPPTSAPPLSSPPLARASAPPPSSPPLGKASTPPASRDSGKIDLRAVAAAPPPAAPSPVASTPPTSVPAPVAASQQLPAAEAKKGSPAPLVIGAVLLLGIGGVFVATRKPAPSQLAPAQAATSAPQVTAEKPAEPKPQAAEAKPAQSAAPEPGVVDINALGAVASASAAALPKVGGPLKPIDKGDKEEKAEKPAEPAPVQAAVSAAPVAPVPMGSVGELKDEMKKRVGAGDSAGGDGPAESGPAAKQDKPSMGQVQGALGTVRNAARSCLDADSDVPTRVSITFGSDGSVKSVSVAGGAAGKPAEACVKAAVMKAKLPPFTADSYSTTMTIRP